jgi:hypothetical protein
MATVQLAYPDYTAQSWHTYLGGFSIAIPASLTLRFWYTVYVAMMFLSYCIICLPTRYVSYFNIWASALGTVVLVVVTILLPCKAPELNSAKDIFTDVRRKLV